MVLVSLWLIPSESRDRMAIEATGSVIVYGPEMPAWIVWEDLSPAEVSTLRGMWNRAVDTWLDWAIHCLETEPSEEDFAVSWDMRYTSLTRGELAELRAIPPGDQRRECLYQMLRRPLGRVPE